MILVAVVFGRLEKATSWFLMISHTMSADETTRVGIWPRCMNIRGPYLSKSARRDRCGSVPSWCRFPISGKLGGDGGKLFSPPDDLVVHTKKSKTDNRQREIRKGCKSVAN
ncbi:hypothetical protein PanWU01x14_067130 [Parasponia andersonii]|uniref:Uncharacterized protein n=1 Tax=Parasponia andersonii TaxID=3476 RepID=A0A2P5DG80_PARAD|nr:hypothetical protein PanWU01x14_067130 [Parasponia andersonii]